MAIVGGLTQHAGADHYTSRACIANMHFIVVGEVTNAVNKAGGPGQRAVYIFRCLWAELNWFQSHLTKVEQVGAPYSSSYAWRGLHRAAKAAQMMQMDEKSSRSCMMSLDECMQARIMHAHSFYLG